VGILGLVYFVYAVTMRKANPRAGKIVSSVFVGLLDLQGVTGLLAVALGLYYPALLGHVFTMIGAIAAAHIFTAMAKSSSDPHRANQLRLMAFATALLLITVGVLAIGRALFSTGVPSVG
jgi:heme A synthase